MSATRRLDSATVALALLAGTAVSVAEIVSSSHSRAVQVSIVSEKEHGGHERFFRVRCAYFLRKIFQEYICSVFRL